MYTKWAFWYENIPSGSPGDTTGENCQKQRREREIEKKEGVARNESEEKMELLEKQKERMIKERIRNRSKKRGNGCLKRTEDGRLK
jgi:hypothetical protein